MTGADIAWENSNVWTFNVSGQSWTALSDISGSGTSIAAGQGFLVYVFEDTNNDGSADLPATLSVSGTENSGSATYPASGSIAANAWGLAGNPYYSTIDWDDVTKLTLPQLHMFGMTLLVPIKAGMVLLEDFPMD